MKLRRIWTPIFLALTLLFAQQGLAAHALGHAFEHSRPKDGKPSQADTCEQCAAYAQIGSALDAGNLEFKPVVPLRSAVLHGFFCLNPITFHSATARGPPSLLVAA